jgi:16S rRNA C967 or C1407 C5-methylase (RsmB/RsmF family)/NOL1/NOP2/fmu family ribosome biogenesis protein
MMMKSKSSHIEIPGLFIQRLTAHWGMEMANSIIQALDREPSVSVSKRNDDQLWPDEEVIPATACGVYLPTRPSFTLDPRFHVGAYYPQESSSMSIFSIIQELAKKTILSRVIDLCAAPGGKSIILHKALPDAEVVVSNEVQAKRNVILVENLIKWGDPRVIVAQSPLHEIGGEESWDFALLDAPCSGEGMFRKDHNARQEWSLENVNRCAGVQSDLIREAGRMLRKDGFLMYSTCTFSREENEAHCEELMNSGDWECFSDFELPDGAVWTEGHGYKAIQFLPHIARGEGFFCVIFKKKNTFRADTHHKVRKSNTYWQPVSKSVWEVVKEWIEIDKSDLIMNAEGAVHWYTGGFSTLSKLDRPRLVGIPMGVVMKDKFIPHQGLITSGKCQSHVPFIECSLEEALHVLRGQDWRTEHTYSSGWYRARWNGFDFAWLKAVGNRFSNHYPKDWRIRHL